MFCGVRCSFFSTVLIRRLGRTSLKCRTISVTLLILIPDNFDILQQTRNFCVLPNTIPPFPLQVSPLFNSIYIRLCPVCIVFTFNVPNRLNLPFLITRLTGWLVPIPAVPRALRFLFSLFTWSCCFRFCPALPRAAFSLTGLTIVYQTTLLTGCIYFAFQFKLDFCYQFKKSYCCVCL